MTNGIIGKKLGMTQVFGEGGARAVTAIEAGPCTVTQVKTVGRDGYQAVQLGFGEMKARRSPRKGAASEKGTARFRCVREFPLGEGQVFEPGQQIDVSLFKAGDMVDITGTSKGKGFAGGVKRHHFKGGPKTHGQSDRHRSPGSLGAGSSPGRVFKGLRMAGHMGHERVTVSHLEVVEADPARNLLLIKGAVPGMTNGLLLIRKSKRGKK
jgi:large subunit ribosomal protein L3